MHLFYIYFYVHAFDLLIFKLLHCFKCTYTTHVSLDAVCLCQALIFYIYVYKGISSSVATHVNPYQCVSPSVQTTNQVQLSRLQSWLYYLEIYNVLVQVQFTKRKTELEKRNIQYKMLCIQVCSRFTERRKTQNDGKIENVKIFLNLGRDTIQCSFSFQEIKLWQQH